MEKEKNSRRHPRRQEDDFVHYISKIYEQGIIVNSAVVVILKQSR